jgi:opacity protein-like surface antigen
MHKTLTSVVALAGLAAAAGAAEAADAVIAGDTDEPMLLTSTQMDAVTAGGSSFTSTFVSGYGTVYTSDVHRVGYGYGYAFISADIFPYGSLFVDLTARGSSF